MHYAHWLDSITGQLHASVHNANAGMILLFANPGIHAPYPYFIFPGGCTEYSTCLEIKQVCRNDRPKACVGTQPGVGCGETAPASNRLDRGGADRAARNKRTVKPDRLPDVSTETDKLQNPFGDVAARCAGIRPVM